MKKHIQHILFLLVVLSLVTCKKRPDAPTYTNKRGVPVVLLDSINITLSTALCYSNVINDSNSQVNVHGVCWNTTGNPTLENSMGHTNDGSGMGTFISTIMGLTEYTIYYVASFATNEKGTAYGETRSFETNFFIDSRDGQEYAYIEIGNQTWMAENLNYQTTDSWWYNNSSANGDVYGRLYTWEAALTACPGGWHLPGDEEWKTMEIALGMSQSEAEGTGYRGTDEGKKMKSTSGWYNDGNGTNSSGFNALPGGYRDSYGSFNYHGNDGHWWSSTEYSGVRAWRRTLRYDYDQARRNDYYKTYGFSVRCLKD
jgi:uncharacterized protein (TIGR02145 family)